MYGICYQHMLSLLAARANLATSKPCTVSDFTLSKNVHAKIVLENQFSLALSGRFYSGSSKYWYYSGTLIFESKSLNYEVCLDRFKTDLRSGPKFVDLIVPNTKYWWIWLTHDILGSMKAYLSLAEVQNVLSQLLVHSKLAPTVQALVMKITNATADSWFEQKVVPNSFCRAA